MNPLSGYTNQLAMRPPEPAKAAGTAAKPPVRITLKLKPPQPDSREAKALASAKGAMRHIATALEGDDPSIDLPEDAGERKWMLYFLGTLGLADKQDLADIAARDLHGPSEEPIGPGDEPETETGPSQLAPAQLMRTTGGMASIPEIALATTGITHAAGATAAMPDHLALPDGAVRQSAAGAIVITEDSPKLGISYQWTFDKTAVGKMAEAFDCKPHEVMDQLGGLAMKRAQDLVDWLKHHRIETDWVEVPLTTA